MGRGTHRRRTLAENRSSNFSSDDSTLYSEAPSAPGGSGPALDDFRAQSHEGHHRQRHLCRCDSNVSVDLRVRDHGTRHQAHPSLLTSLNIRRPSGRFNSSENALAVRKDTDSLSMIVTVSILKTWISR